MKKFRYSMQSILDVKYRLEDQAKGEFALAVARHQEEVEKEEQMKCQKVEYEQELKERMLDKLDFREIAITKAGIRFMEDQIRKQKRVVAMANHEVEVAREKLSDLMIERKTQEKLRENAFDRYKKEISAEEMKEIDEIVSFRFNNQQ